MNTLDKSADDDTAAEQALVDQASENISVDKLEITGFDGGTRSFLQEPSLYVSLATVFVIAVVSMNKSPLMFWFSFGTMSALAIIFHVLAEQALFKGKKEFKGFIAPFDGVFVVTFGALLPGLGLLAYGVYSLLSSFGPNPIEEIGKMLLLLLVPICNFSVWSAVRKGYLIRPRLVGLMNGLGLGLSASWTLIWLNFLFVDNSTSSKFGWMLLLCVSPFLFAAAVRLCLDLWRKTDPNMRRITSTFAVLGGVLSGLLVFSPMVHVFWIQSLVADAKQDVGAKQASAIAMLRSTATPVDLRPSQYPVSGFTLAQMLIPHRGLDSGSNPDKDLYFKITGKQYSTTEGKDENPTVAALIPGLSLAKSQITGSVDTASLSASTDWTFTLHNSTSVDQEACGEIALPKGAAVSRVTLWINGQPREGAFASTSKTQVAYQSVVNRRKDPLLVTMPAADRILVRCFPVPACGGDMKFRIGLKLPIDIAANNYCLQLPKVTEANFAQPKRHRISVLSPEVLAQEIPGIATTKSGSSYTFDGILKPDKSKQLSSLLIRRTAPFTEFATPDWYSHGQRFIVQQLREVGAVAPKRLFVVIDSSGSIAAHAQEIRSALSLLPTNCKTAVYFAPEQTAPNDAAPSFSAMSLKQAESMITPDAFIGGQNNEPIVREVLETAAESQDSAVLWIHGTQPTPRNATESPALDLVHSVCLYDLQVEPGPASLMQALQVEDASNLLTSVSVPHKSLLADVKQLVSGWENGDKKVSIQRTISKTCPNMRVILDNSISAQVTSLWAKEQVSRLLSAGDKQQAEQLASNYRLVTPVTGAVVLENASDYAANKLDPGAYKDSTPDTYRGMHQFFNDDIVGNMWSGVTNQGLHLVGAPVDPRFGQSNEVGQLADYGYDTARDVTRVVTLLSLIISLFAALAFLRSRKKLTVTAIGKAVALVLIVPTVVHVVGTFMINNFGGLGGGL